MLASPALRAEDKPQDKDKPTPKEQYGALVKGYSDAQQAYFSAMRAAKTDDERKKAAELSPKAEKYAALFLELAEKHPKDPVAIDALVWIVTNTGSAAKVEKGRAFEILLRDHIESDKLGLACQNLASGFDKKNESFLRAVLEKNPHKAVKADASLALAQNLQQRAGLVKRMTDDPNSQTKSEFGRDVAVDLKKADLAKLEAESEAAFREFVDRYASDMKSERIAQTCQRLSFSTDKGGQYLLRTLLEKDKRRDVQGVACLTLGQSLKQQADADADKDPKAAAKLRAECEALFERAEKDYADVKTAFRGTVGEKAKTEPVRDSAPAPAEGAGRGGRDQDGKKFKLSDYWKGGVARLLSEF